MAIHTDNVFNNHASFPDIIGRENVCNVHRNLDVSSTLTVDRKVTHITTAGTVVLNESTSLPTWVKGGITFPVIGTVIAKRGQMTF